MSEQTTPVGFVAKPQVDPSHYGRWYDSKPRLASYWHQIKEVVSAKAQSVLAVGVGSGFVVDSLRTNGVTVKTLDIDSRLEPDVLGSVAAIPMGDKEVDLSLCCQVLEHLPWTEFRKCMKELCRVSRQSVVISLPDRTAYIQCRLEIFGWRLRGFKTVPSWLDVGSRIRQIHTDEHYWEIGVEPIRLRDVNAAIVDSGGRILKSYRVRENPYHRFFVIAP